MVDLDVHTLKLVVFRASTSDASPEKESIPLMDYVLNVVNIYLNMSESYGIPQKTFVWF